MKVKVADIISDIRYGFTGSATSVRNGIGFIRVTDIDEGGRVNYLNVPGVIITDNEAKRYLLENGDCIIARSGSVGKAHIYSSKSTKDVFASYLIRLRFDRQKIDPNYFAAFTKSEIYWKQIRSNKQGGVQQNINTDGLSRIEISLPDLKTQARVAALIEQIDSARQKRKKANQLTEQYLQSVFLEMFGDPVRNEKRWEIATFNEVGSLDRGISKHRPRNAPHLLGGPYPLIQTSEVANCKGYIKKYTQTYSEEGLKQSKMWSKGTLLITIAANIAKTGILTFDACFPDSIVGFIPNKKTRAEYIQYWISFLQKSLEENAPESAQKNINLEILRNLKLPLPPLPLQQKFAKIVEQVEQLRNKQRESEKQLDNLFHSMMQRYFG